MVGSDNTRYAGRLTEGGVRSLLKRGDTGRHGDTIPRFPGWTGGNRTGISIENGEIRKGCGLDQPLLDSNVGYSFRNRERGKMN